MQISLYFLTNSSRETVLLRIDRTEVRTLGTDLIEGKRSRGFFFPGLLGQISIDSRGDFLLAWSNETGIGPELEMVILVVDLQTVVNSVVRDGTRGGSIGVEGTLEVMRYLMRHELSIRADFPWHHDLVPAPRVTPLKNESSLSACRHPLDSVSSSRGTSSIRLEFNQLFHGEYQFSARGRNPPRFAFPLRDTASTAFLPPFSPLDR